MLTLCLDIGGTKIAAGLADPAGTLVHTAQRPTPAYGGAEQVWAAVAEMIADALGVAGGRGRWCGDRLGRSYRPTQRPRQPDQHRILGRLSAAGSGRRRGPGGSGAAGG